MTNHTPIVQVPMRGIVRDLPNSVYHSLSDAVSNSGLNDFAKSPSHYWNRHRNPNRPPRKVKGGQLEGTLAHCALFEPYEFARRYAVGPSVNKATSVWKAFAAECAEAGIEPISQDQHDTAFAQAASVRAVPEAAELLASGRPEVSAFWVDEQTGVRCRCRPDWVHDVRDGAVIIADLKTFSSACPEDFALQAARKGYATQGALYSDGYEIATGCEVLAFLNLVVETEWPFVASVVMFDEPSIEAGRRKYRSLLPRFAECAAKDEWPGFGGIELISLPRYAMNEDF